MRSQFYRLVGQTPVPCDPEEWNHAFEGDRLVALDAVSGYTVSTVFLGLDHRIGDGAPLLFETMVFGPTGAFEDYQQRCSTWEEARQQHAAAMRWAAARPATAWQAVAERLGDIDVEDGGRARIARVCRAGDDDFWVALHSWSEDRHHVFFDRLIGRRVRVTVEILDTIGPAADAP